MVRFVKYLIMLLFILSIIGCSAKPEVIVKTVEVPIPVECPKPPPQAFERPTLPIHGLSPKSTDKEVAKAYAETIKILQGWGLTLEEYLRGYSD